MAIAESEYSAYEVSTLLFIQCQFSLGPVSIIED